MITMGVETLSNQEDLLASELKEFWWELNDLKQEILGPAEHVEKQPRLVHYSKLSPEELSMTEIANKQKLDFFQDQLTWLTSERTSMATKEWAIKGILRLFTPDATVNYIWKVRWQRRTLMNLSINEFLHLIANWDIKVDNLTSGEGSLREKSQRTWSPLLEPEVLNLPDVEKAYKAKISGIEIYDLSPEKLSNIPNLNSDRWGSDSNEVLTK